jgi:hypothetical protein
MFPLTGYFPFYKGALGYRFFINDAISFSKSLRVAIGFGTNEHTMFRTEFSKRGSTLQLSSVVYWYQVEPHASLPPMPPAAERAPAPEEPFWPDKEELPTPAALKKRGCSLLMLCGRPEKEIIHAEAGFAAVARSGYAYDGWNLPVYHCRAADQELNIELEVPKAAQGTIRLYMVDPDNFQGGRKQTVTVAGKSLGLVENFREGRWLEQSISPRESADGKILIQARNARQGSNAVISIIEWLQKK